MKIKLIILSLSVSMGLYAQDLKTERTPDWNKIYKSGFYESLTGSSQNNPAHNNTSGIWFWGVNLSHMPNGQNYRYNGQMLFQVNVSPTTIPSVYVRSTNQQGEGIWAKVLHSKGNHAIDGKLTAKEIEIKVITGADFVFEPDYNLKPLSEVEAFVKENKHLPEIPSEKEMIENGLNVNEMQIKLLQKIEELTLYVIDLKKENEEQGKRLEKQEIMIREMRNRSID